MSHLSSADLDALGRRLREIRARALQEIQSEAGMDAALPSGPEPRDRADLAEPLRQEEVRWAEMEIDRHTLADVERALTRLAHGEYGICVDCQAAIPQGRLFAQPAAIRCAACQAIAEATRRA